MSSTDPPLPPSPDEPTDEPQWGGGESRGEPIENPDEAEVPPVPEGGAGTEPASPEEPAEPETAEPETGDELPTEQPPTEVLPAEDVPTEALPASGEGGTAEDTEVTGVLPVTGDDVTTLLPPTGDEPTAVMAGAAGAVVADGTGEWTREHRRRVSHRRYVMRRIAVGIVALAIVGGGIALLVALLGGDDDEAGGGGSTVPDSTEAAVPPPTATTAPATTQAATETTTAAATTEPAEAQSTAASPETDPAEETAPNETTAAEASDTTVATESSPPGTVVYDLESDATCEIGQTLRRGDSGPQVQCVQERLNEVTTGGQALPEDGAFGEQTEAAVRAFQEANELGVDGVVGPATGELLGIWAG